MAQNLWVGKHNQRPPFYAFSLLSRLTAVSSFWRSIIINLPILWTNVHYWRPRIFVSLLGVSWSDIDPRLPKVVHILELYLQRSQSLLLDMNIGGADMPLSPERTNLETLLLPHIWRVQTLEISLVGRTKNSILLPLPPTDHLKTFRLRSYYDRRGRAPVLISSEPTLVTSLRILDIWTDTATNPVAYDSLPTVSLEELGLSVQLYPQVPSGFFQFLGRCTSLRKLALLQKELPGEITPITPQSIALPIISLDISPSILPLLVHKIQTPGLRTLLIKAYSGDRGIFPPVRLPTWPNLVKISFDHVRPTEKVADFLAANPSVISLEIMRCSWHISFIILLLGGLVGMETEAMIAQCFCDGLVKPDLGWLCPGLEYLKFSLSAKSLVSRAFFPLVEGLLATRPKLRIAVRGEDFALSTAGVDGVKAEFGERFVDLSRS